MRILVVEDELVLRESLRADFTAAGFTVDVAADGEEGLFAGLENPLDAIVLDLGLPKMDGLEVLSTLRARGCNLPVLVLTARGHWQDSVQVLEAGADDYVSKPFVFEEVLARVNVMVRRTGRWATSEFVCGPILLNSLQKFVRLNGALVELTVFEYNVLEYLMLRAGEVVTKTELLERLYEEEVGPDYNVIDGFVARLRKKLDPTGELQPIETVRGVGYRFALSRSR